MQTPFETPFSSCCIYHQTLSRVRVERKALSLCSCIAQFDPQSRDHVGHTPSRSVGDIEAFQNTFAFIISTETCFWLKRVSDRTFFSVSERHFQPPNQNSFAFIICKNHPESRLETLILCQESDDKRTQKLLFEYASWHLPHFILYSGGLLYEICIIIMWHCSKPICSQPIKIKHLGSL